MKTRSHVTRLCAVVAAILTLTGANLIAVVATLDDLNYWGIGTNRSAFVVNWNDGKTNEVLAWGFRWNGPAPNVTDMMIGLASLDPNLFLRIDSLTGFGAAVFGIGYDSQNNLTFSVAGAVDTVGDPAVPVFVAGVSDMNTNSTTLQSPPTSTAAGPADALDHYVEGWNDNGYWEFFTGTVGLAYPPTWTSSPTGTGDTILVDQGWYALSISNPDFSPNVPGSAVAAVPEPSTVAFVTVAFIGLLLFHARKRLHSH